MEEQSKKYSVNIPMMCEVTIWIEAHSPKEAFKKAREAIDKESFTRMPENADKGDLTICIERDGSELTSYAACFVTERKDTE